MAKEESSLLNTSTASATAAAAAAAAAASASTASAGAASAGVVKKTDPIFMEADGGGGGGNGCASNASSFSNSCSGLSGNSSSSNSNSNSSNSSHDGPKLFDGFKHVNPRSTTLTSSDLNSFQSTEVINSIIQDSLNKIDVSNPLFDLDNPHQASSMASADQGTYPPLTAPLTSRCHFNDQIPAQLSLSSFGTPRIPPSFVTLPNSNNTSSFETKVKQIAKNLKETSLTDTQSQTVVGNVNTNSNTNSNARKSSIDDNNPSASTSTASASPSISSSSISIDYDTPLPTNTNDDVQCIGNSELNVSLQSVSESTDDTDHRSKKVRFHPDVKENDGGNRIIPKKKKKLKLSSNACVDEAMPSTSAAAAAANAIRMSNGDDDMETEEEDDFDEEEDFDLEKTIAEANDFLKEHPLTFARAQDRRIKRIRNGLYDEGDLPENIDCSEDEENFYEHIQPENGIERILGKQTKGNRVEFLLRYVDRPGLYWEQGEVIARTCPMLLDIYEMFRERRQERLMRYVATRQNIRQRYTDF